MICIIHITSSLGRNESELSFRILASRYRMDETKEWIILLPYCCTQTLAPSKCLGFYFLLSCLLVYPNIHDCECFRACVFFTYQSYFLVLRTICLYSFQGSSEDLHICFSALPFVALREVGRTTPNRPPSFRFAELRLAKVGAMVGKVYSPGKPRQGNLCTMKLLAAKLRGICGILRSIQPCFAKASQGSPRLHPRSKLRGTRRRRKETSPGVAPGIKSHKGVGAGLVSLLSILAGVQRDDAAPQS